jgi:hypothetical protein
VSSDPVVPKDVRSGVVDAGGSSLFGPAAEVWLSWATDTPTTASNRSTRVVRTTARYMDCPRLYV